MNEIANFCNGECSYEVPNKCIKSQNFYESDPHDPSEFDNLPYYPGNCDLNQMQVSVTGYHYSTNEFEDKVRKEYNTHSIWNLYQCKATYEYFVDNLKVRPFVLTRSNFPGSGMYASLWLGDNFSRWEYMRYSISGIYNFQLFGMPVVGADMCGFLENSNEELCARWLQLGIFTPFSRNHNDLNKVDHEPHVFGQETIIATKNAMRQKYSIMMYYYTKLFEVSLNGGTLIRPLFFEFPKDNGTYSRTDNMFMIGPSILIPPVLYPNTSKVYPYFPNEDWYNLKDFTKVFSYDSREESGKEIELNAGFDYVNVLLRGGSIIPYQDALGLNLIRIEQLKENDMQLLIAPDHSGMASGTLIIDDGVSLQTIENNKYQYLKFDFSMIDESLTVTALNCWAGKKKKPEKLTSILIFGAEKWKSMKDLCVTTNDDKKINTAGNYDIVKKNLIFYNPDHEVYWRDIKLIKFGQKC